MAKKKLVKIVKLCRICKSSDLKEVINLGKTPPANSFLTKPQLNQSENFFPLKVNFCNNCHLLQLSHSVSPELLFKDYLYVSSTSPVFVKHFEEYAEDVCSYLRSDKNSLIVDIGSNDGILLQPFKKLGMRVLGIDPAEDIAQKATKAGLTTIPGFFNQVVATGVLNEYGPASVITANNVFAHIPDIDEIATAVKILLDKDGVFITEFPYLVDFLENNLFDTIYHEHVSYFAISPLMTFFNNHQLEIIKVKKVSSHGGSVRVFVKRQSSNRETDPSVGSFIDNELNLNLDDINTYKKFAQKIEKNKAELTSLINQIKKDGGSIAGYGAPAKGNTLLNYFKLGPEQIDYIVDDSPLKQGLYTPGTHIPVVSSDQLRSTLPDYLLILAWNFAESIMAKNQWFKDQGGKFILPVPSPKKI